MRGGRGVGGGRKCRICKRWSCVGGFLCFWICMMGVVKLEVGAVDFVQGVSEWVWAFWMDVYSREE